MQLPTLRLIAAVEEAEAVADNIVEAITLDIERRVGSADSSARIVPLNGGFDVGGRNGGGSGSNFLDFVITRILDALLLLLLRQIGIANSLAKFIVDVANGILDGTADLLDALQDGLEDFIEGQIKKILDRLDGLADEITDAISDILDEGLGELSDAIRDAIEKGLAKVLEAIEGLGKAIGRIEEGIGEVISTLEGLEESITDRIKVGVDKVLDRLDEVEDNVIAKVEEGIATTVTEGEKTRGVVEDGVTRILAGQVGIGEGIAERVTDAVTLAVRTEVAPIIGSMQSIETEVEGTGLSLLQMVQALAAGATGQPIGGLLEWGSTLLEGVDIGFENLLGRIGANLSSFLERALIALGLRPEAARLMAGSLGAADPESFVISAGLFVGVVAFSLPIIGAQIMQPFINEVVQEIERRVGSALLGAPDLLELVRRGEIDEAELRNQLDQAGFDEAQQARILGLQRTLLGVREVIDLWLRGELDEVAMTGRLSELGIEPAQAAELRELAFFLPSVSDLILFAVREVFSPELRTRFQLDADFPPIFAEQAAKAGVSRELAGNFWAAHWALPSVGQGFQMLQRRFIEPEDLDLLLRAQDVMPFWRENLTKIAFRPLTRVDVRRMHKLGLLTPEEVSLRFQDQGFSKADADLQTEFVIRFNDPDPSEELDEVEGLTRSTVLGMFEDGILKERQAKELLADLGVSDTAIDLFILQRELEIERDRRKAEISLVVARVRSGDLSFDQGQDELGRLGMEPAELNRAIEQIRRLEESRTTLPAEAALTKMLGAGIIDDSKYVDTLERRGFSTEWAQAFLALATAEGEEEPAAGEVIGSPTEEEEEGELGI